MLIPDPGARRVVAVRILVIHPDKVGRHRPVVVDVGLLWRDHVELQQVAAQSRQLVQLDQRLDVTGEQLVVLGVVPFGRTDRDAVGRVLGKAQAKVVSLDAVVAIAGPEVRGLPLNEREQTARRVARRDVRIDGPEEIVWTDAIHEVSPVVTHLKTMRAKGRGVIGFWLMHCLERPETMMSAPLRDLFERAARGEIKPQLGNVYPLADVRQAHEDLAGRRTTGKLMLDPHR